MDKVALNLSHLNKGGIMPTRVAGVLGSLTLKVDEQPAVDYNTYQDEGIYYFTSTIADHAPSTMRPGANVMVVYAKGTWGLQELTNRHGQKFIRGWNGTTFIEWKEL